MSIADCAIETRELTEVCGRHLRAVNRLNLTVRMGEAYGVRGAKRCGDDHHAFARWDALGCTDTR